MASYNRVTLVGNLGADPELKYAGDRPVANMSLATTETWKDKGGQKQERTDWHRIVIWGPQAESCAKFLSKGRQCLVEGKIQYRTYEKDGQKKYITEIQAERVVFLGSGSGDGASGGGAGKHREEHARGGQQDDNEPPLGGDDDIPF